MIDYADIVSGLTGFVVGGVLLLEAIMWARWGRSVKFTRILGLCIMLVSYGAYMTLDRSSAVVNATSIGFDIGLMITLISAYWRHDEKEAHASKEEVQTSQAKDPASLGG